MPRLSLFLLLIPLATLFATGCSVIGFTTGAIIDAGCPDATQVSDASGLDPDGNVTLVLADSTRIHGRYVGPVSLDSTRYAERFAAFLRNHQPAYSGPRPGDIVSFRHGATVAPGGWIFRGFGMKTLNLQRPGQPLVASFPFSHINALFTTSGDSVDLHALETGPDLPHDGAFGIRIATDTITIPLDDVALIYKHPANAAKWTGLVAGLAADAIVVTFAIASHPFHPIRFGGDR